MEYVIVVWMIERDIPRRIFTFRFFFLLQIIRYLDEQYDAYLYHCIFSFVTVVVDPEYKVKIGLPSFGSIIDIFLCFVHSFPFHSRALVFFFREKKKKLQFLLMSSIRLLLHGDSVVNFKILGKLIKCLMQVCVCVYVLRWFAL